MNKKILCAALLGGLSLANHATAQEFDDRWSLTGSATGAGAVATTGVGRRIPAIT